MELLPILEEDTAIAQSAAARWLAQRDVVIPVLAISTKDEQTKFEAEMGTYVRPRHSAQPLPDATDASDLHSSVDYETWAADWNNIVGEMEQGKTRVVNVTRKSATAAQAIPHETTKRA